MHDILCNADATCLGGGLRSSSPRRGTPAHHHQCITLQAASTRTCCLTSCTAHATACRGRPVACPPCVRPCCRRGRAGHGPVRRRPRAGHQAAMTLSPVTAVPRCCATVLLLLPPGQHGAGPAARISLLPGPGRRRGRGRGAPAPVQAAAHRLLPKRWARSPSFSPHLPRLLVLPCWAMRCDVLCHGSTTWTVACFHVFPAQGGRCLCHSLRGVSSAWGGGGGGRVYVFP